VCTGFYTQSFDCGGCEVDNGHNLTQGALFMLPSDGG
jgi:hypothetical protein